MEGRAHAGRQLQPEAGEAGVGGDERQAPVADGRAVLQRQRAQAGQAAEGLQARQRHPALPAQVDMGQAGQGRQAGAHRVADLGQAYASSNARRVSVLSWRAPPATDTHTAR